MAETDRWRRNNPKLKFDDFPKIRYNYFDRYDLYEFVISSENLKEQAVDYYEFGVASGDTFRWCEQLKNPNNRFYGFDTFEGLPEDFGIREKGHFSQGGNLVVVNDDRAKMVKGLFQDSLVPFIKEHDLLKNRKVIHIDCDLYTATYFVLNKMEPFLQKNDIILLDEFLVPAHEFKAFTEFCDAYYKRFTTIAAVNNYMQIAVKV